MAKERIDIPLLIGGAEVRTGDTAKVRHAARPRPRPREWHHAAREHVAAGDRGGGAAAHREWSQLAVGRSRGGLPARGRAAHHDLARDP